MLENQSSRPTGLMYLALSGLAVPIVFTLLVIIGGFAQDGYSHASQAISELAGVEATNPLIQNLNFVISGLLIMGFAWGLHLGINRGQGAVIGPALVGFFGLTTAFAQPLLPCDAGCEFETLTGTLHNVTGMTSFLAVVAGMVLVSRRVKDDPWWRSYRGYSLIMGAVSLAALIAWIAISKAAGVESVNGLLQRVFVGAALSWIGVMGYHMFELSRRSER